LRQRAAKENDMTYKNRRYYRPNSVAATVDFMQSMPLVIREQRASHLRERDRQQRLAAARADVEAAREAFEKAKAVVPETAALDAAMKGLAEIEGEVKHDA
jgi:hypothetical protein